jgi:hypothetical protein
MLCSARSCAIQTIAESSLPVRARTSGTAALAEIASSAARSQVIVRVFTLVLSIAIAVACRIALFNHRRVTVLQGSSSRNYNCA